MPLFLDCLYVIYFIYEAFNNSLLTKPCNFIRLRTFTKIFLLRLADLQLIKKIKCPILNNSYMIYVTNFFGRLYLKENSITNE